jgi:hypothetical protein
MIPNFPIHSLTKLRTISGENIKMNRKEKIKNAAQEVGKGIALMMLAIFIYIVVFV